MSTLNFTILDLGFPAGSKNETATLVTGDTEARAKVAKGEMTWG
jgi:hypothetical protein